MIERSKELLSLKHYSTGGYPTIVRQENLYPPEERQYVLRMLIRRPGDEMFLVPPEYIWIFRMLETACRHQMEKFGVDALHNRFVYMTIRHGEVTSVTDDVWHVDGFSMRVPHVPEQNYIWSDSYPTEFYPHGINVPDDFDPMKHNLHWFFQDVISQYDMISTAPNKSVICMDAYHIHRRPRVPAGTKRTMVRISFVPVQIESDDCQQNPYFPEQKFNRPDIRDTLTRYGDR